MSRHAMDKKLHSLFSFALYSSVICFYLFSPPLLSAPHGHSQQSGEAFDGLSLAKRKMSQLIGNQDLEIYLKAPHGQLELEFIQRFPNLSLENLKNIFEEEPEKILFYIRGKDLWPESSIRELRKLSLVEKSKDKVYALKKAVPGIPLALAKEVASKELPNILMANLAKLLPADLKRIAQSKNHPFKERQISEGQEEILEKVLGKIKHFTLDEFILLIHQEKFTNSAYDESLSVFQYLPDLTLTEYLKFDQNKVDIKKLKSNYALEKILSKIKEKSPEDFANLLGLSLSKSIYDEPLSIFKIFPDLTLKEYIQLDQAKVSLSELRQLQFTFPKLDLKDILELAPYKISEMNILYNSYPEKMPKTLVDLKNLAKAGLNFSLANRIFRATQEVPTFASLQDILHYQNTDVKDLPFLYSDQILASFVQEGKKEEDILSPSFLHDQKALIFERQKNQMREFLRIFPEQKFMDLAKFVAQGGDLLDAQDILKLTPKANLEDILQFQKEEGYISHFERMKKVWGMDSLAAATDFLKRGGNMCAAALLKKTFPEISLDDYFQFKAVNKIPIGPALLNKMGLQMSFEEYLEFEKLGGDALKLYGNRQEWAKYSFAEILSFLKVLQQIGEGEEGEEGTEAVCGHEEIGIKGAKGDEGLITLVGVAGGLSDEERSKAKEMALKIVRGQGKSGQEKAENLSTEDKAYITKYTNCGNYREMNRQFTCPTLENDRDIELWDLNIGLIRALGKLKADEVKTYRGFGMAPARALKYIPGTIITEGTFLSTSLRESMAYDWNKGFIYRIKGKSGIDVKNVSHFSHEKEFLFPPQTRFRVASFKPLNMSDSKGIMVIELEEVE